ncbi:MAG: hypothetical protein K9J28_09070, partial [Sulfuritalea sp.]|nr:hypothetical protein [Sulfuritalea sp.]
RLQSSYSFQLRWYAKKPIMFFISTYLALVFFHTSWQTALGVITPDEGVSAIVNFALPVVFFVYFHTIATEQEIRAAFIAMIVAGFAVGIYFVYDSYTLLVLKGFNEYSLKALEYEQMRAPGGELHNTRISPGNRSHGLLENHAVSAAWIALGCFAALKLLLKSQIKIRMAVIFLFGMALLIGLNFTAVLGFTFVIILIEFEGFKLFFGIISKRIFHLLALIFASSILIILTLLILPDSIGIDMFAEISRIFDIQMKIAIGAVNTSEDYTYIGGLINSFVSLPYSMLDFPLGILIGDGFSTFGVAKGGDYGVIDSIHRLGFPFYLCAIVGFVSLITRALKKVDLSGLIIQSASESYLCFAITVIIYLLFSDIHYSIWPTKSLLPILFISLAIFDRYLNHQSSD